LYVCITVAEHHFVVARFLYRRTDNTIGSVRRSIQTNEYGVSLLAGLNGSAELGDSKTCEADAFREKSLQQARSVWPGQGLNNAKPTK
jgi:hypothetical protein